MITEERGGIISKLFIIPAGVVLMLGFFFLGYYVGRYQSKTASQGENMPPMPEIVSKNPQKPEEFTFYKTLTEKEDRTVSIEGKSKSANTGSESVKNQNPDTPLAAEQNTVKESAAESIPEKRLSSPEMTKKTSVTPSQATEKKTVSHKDVHITKLRYTVQVSSHPEKQAAEEDVKRMKQGGFAAHIVTSALEGKGTWYRVRVGSFASKDAAEKLRKEVNAKIGMAPIIVLE
jgi:cell division protein FtsN